MPIDAPAAAPTAIQSADLRARLQGAHLYLCTDAREARGDFDAFVAACFAGGVDIIQLRDKTLEAARELELLGVLARRAAEANALFSANDRADVAILSGADVLHVGQGDLTPAQCRQLVPQALVGRSTHDPQQLAVALADDDVDYFCTGPVWATPTKPGRPGVGLDLVRAAAQASPAQEPQAKPWFAIGGIDEETLGQVVDAGATRAVVVRVLTQAEDPQTVAARLRARLRS
ncbi:thiamine-phosphate pyrophosphorylase [Kineosphaera limosa]|uniref:Thiamine-phosphate synthase n=1 Tax=Kineosphaera limosa NBRC 100340 TaxID=1184609 RepID=K6WTD7_9MICO|nr:thiamine phosphate synthase [Kineosphaera limosa]NYE00323.1 thiamine-phosphate pyrophosphorylase [Kineosphaera limosa]GAB97121.1 thiamine-phosphate pyrophosphorylase [Kineosphaera limosa NBRC 100340]